VLTLVIHRQVSANPGDSSALCHRMRANPGYSSPLRHWVYSNPGDSSALRHRVRAYLGDSSSGECKPMSRHANGASANPAADSSWG